MSAAVWNEPHEPDRRCREPRRTVGAPWETSILIVRAMRTGGEPRPVETTAQR